MIPPSVPRRPIDNVFFPGAKCAACGNELRTAPCREGPDGTKRILDEGTYVSVAQVVLALLCDRCAAECKSIADLRRMLAGAGTFREEVK